MRIATLQLDAVLGDVEGNIQKAGSLLLCHKDRLENLDLLVLPELAFAGMLVQSEPLASRLGQPPPGTSI
jgi:predicted amidohydrolase